MCERQLIQHRKLPEIQAQSSCGTFFFFFFCLKNKEAEIDFGIFLTVTVKDQKEGNYYVRVAEIELKKILSIQICRSFSFSGFASLPLPAGNTPPSLK